MSAGVGISKKHGELSLGLGWARPSEGTVCPGLDDEWALEASYRMQLWPNGTIIPEVQLVIDPFLNPETSTACVFGLRVRWDLYGK